MKPKTFFLPREAIRPDLAPRRGACVATDRITVDDNPVGFMYRDQPRDEIDSGWHFFSGVEPQEYLDDPDYMALYDVNTIANYDRDIIPLLDAPIGSAFERHATSGEVVPTEFPMDPATDQEQQKDGAPNKELKLTSRTADAAPQPPSESAEADVIRTTSGSSNVVDRLATKGDIAA